MCVKGTVALLKDMCTSVLFKMHLGFPDIFEENYQNLYRYKTTEQDKRPEERRFWRPWRQVCKMQKENTKKRECLYAVASKGKPTSSAGSSCFACHKASMTAKFWRAPIMAPIPVGSTETQRKQGSEALRRRTIPDMVYTCVDLVESLFREQDW